MIPNRQNKLSQVAGADEDKQTACETKLVDNAIFLM